MDGQKRRMTLADIAAMTKPTIGTREIHEVTGCDRYGINVAGREGKTVFGCEVFFVGQRRTRAVVSRLEFLKKMGWDATTV